MFDQSGADNQADDGIYSEYFVHFENDNRYSVSGKVINDGSAKILKASDSPANQNHWKRKCIQSNEKLLRYCWKTTH